MPKRALIEHRPWLVASMFAALAFYYLRDTQLPEVQLMAVKAAGVGLLAVYVLRRTHGLDGLLLVLTLALCAAADAVLVLDMTTGGAIFAAAHVVACILYLRNRRNRPTQSQMLLGAALLVGVPGISYLLSGDPMIGVYAITLGAMAATAWTSRFPRYRVGVGAVLFVVSDWLIFSEVGPYDLGSIPHWLIWPLYYVGVLMIATGVVQTLRGEKPAR